MPTASALGSLASRTYRNAGAGLRIVASLLASVMMALASAAAGHANQQSAPNSPRTEKPSLVASLTSDPSFTVQCSNRSVAYENVYAQRFFGYHGWTARVVNERVASTERMIGKTSLRWDSDASSATKDFIVCTCIPNAKEPASAIALSWTGAEIRFANKDGSGSGGGLILAVYEQAVPPSLFKDKEINLENPKPLFSRKWPKKEKLSLLQLGPLKETVRFSPKARRLYIVLAGVDPWFDTRVTITITGVYVDKPTSANRSLKK